MKRSLVLVFCVLVCCVLVAAGACRKNERAATNLNVANKVAVRLVKLYYESPRMLLAPESRSISLPESPAAAIPVVVTELLKGPAADGSLRLFPEDTFVRGAYLLPGGTAVIDLGGPTLTNGWGTGSHQELMAAYSLAQTLSSNFSDVTRVRILINGTPAETLAGHLSLARSLSPKPALVEP